MKSQVKKTKPTILVVDDEQDNLDLLYRTFYRQYKVLKATSGPDALNLLAKEGDVAVIISDQRMPMMSGTEFLSLTATQYPDIIRIILTGYTDVEDLVDAINTGKVFKYVTKPWEAEELAVVVRQALDTHNVLKARTQELTRTLRQESLLNTVTNTIRGALDYGQILQTIVDSVGQMLEVDVCLLRPFQNGKLVHEGFVYQKRANLENAESSEDNSAHLSVLTQTVWETNEVLVIQDVNNDERIYGDTIELQQRAAAFSQANISSSLIVPLICRQELMAVMALHQCHGVEESHQPEQRLWEDDEVKMLMMLADQAALALSQAYAYEQVRSLAKREVLINTVTSSIRSSLDPQEIFAAITQQLGQALQVDGCVLSLWTQEDEYVDCVGLYDAIANKDEQNLGNIPPLNHQQLPQSQVPIRGNPILQEMLRTQEPVIVGDMNHISPQDKGFDLPLRDISRSLMVVPLLADGKSIGSITLREIARARQWTTSEVELAKSVAAQAAIAVQQSRLYQTTREQAERLLELDKQKTEFFQNISHEFRTPITLIQGPLESAVATGDGLSPEQSTIALRNSRRLLRLVNQLLDLQRLDAKKMQPSFRPCDLVEFVNQIVESFSPYCEKKEISVLTQLEPCPQVYLDAEKFDKVVYNLLSNAMKFTPSGGTITVTIKQTGEDCILEVTDTGIGIAEQQIPHLFERFRQAEGSENRSYEGTGLGLALVKELVEIHGGNITVQSVYGEGTTFTVSLIPGANHLPPEQIQEASTQVNINRATVELADLELIESIEDIENIKIELPENKEYNNSTNGKGHLILVVDDNPDLRTYVSHTLTASGYKVQTARNGAEGFQIAKQITPNLIISDLMMPLVSGLDMIQMIRNQENLRGIPIILLTAKVDEETRISGTEQGADAYLAKPFNDRELLAEVKNLLALKENEKRVVELNSYLTESVLQRFLPPAL
ncbi:MAG: response regulator, partial [Calothrix sp. MO_167.B42]|nr:response regulator [Calothrix sp. MO_167.B42]